MHPMHSLAPVQRWILWASCLGAKHADCGAWGTSEALHDQKQHSAAQSHKSRHSSRLALCSHGGQQRGGGHVRGVCVLGGQAMRAPAQRGELARGPLGVALHLCTVVCVWQ